MSPELYFAVMLITNPQKARRILLAEELENWFMDLFDDEFEDILEGTFKDNQELYIDRIVDKYLEMTGVSMTDTDEYSRTVINKAFKTASEIQDTTWRNLTVPYRNRKATLGVQNIGQQSLEQDTISQMIKNGIAISTAIFANEAITRWLGRDRANLIALNEANWKFNNEEFFEAKATNKRKTWHTALDERVRLTHIALEGKTIGIDEKFNVGGYLGLYPLDSNLPIHETANCRCSVSYS